MTNKFPETMKETAVPDGSAATSDLASLFNYPSLGRLFDVPNSSALAEMRERLARTNQDLERVVRQGSKDDAERAARITRALAATLALLDDLAELQRSTAK